MQDYQERIQMDRYAIKNPDAQPKVGDLVMLTMKRQFEQDGEPIDSRELGTITRVWTASGGTEIVYSAALVDKAKPQNTWEVVEHLSRNQLDVLVETSYGDICRRVSHGIIKLEPENTEFESDVLTAMMNEEFVPAGRILAGVGREDITLTLFNCYVFPPPHDSRGGIAHHWKMIFDTYGLGGGIGWHCSTLRPKGARVKKVNGRSSGVVSWMEQFSQITGAVEQGGTRRGAGLQGLWVWHPDIIDFVEAKSQRTSFTLEDGREVSRNKDLISNSNVSVLISDKFMEAVKSDAMWDLVFPDLDDPDYDQVWTGELEEWTEANHKVVIYKRVKARWLWELIIKKAWESGEPGLLFMDRANKMSNSWYYNKLICTNPCGEQALPSFGICNLGHLHLAKFIRSDADQFPETEIDSETAIKRIDWTRFRQVISTAVRFLDNIVDINQYHIDEVEAQQKRERRIGLGVLGYAELLVRLGLRYGSPEAEKFTHYLFRRFSKYSYLASVDLAKERGSFPAFDKEKFCQSGFMKIHDEEVISAVQEHGIRNVTLNTAAPTGSVGTMLNTTTGIEPYFLAEWTARSRIGSANEEANVVSELKRRFGKQLPSYFATTDTVTPEEHVRTLAAVQRWIDSSIAKTVNMPNTATVEDASKVYTMLYDLGCKGGTIYRDRSRDRQVLYHKGSEPKIPVEIVDPYMKGSDDASQEVDVIRPRIKAGLSVTLSQKTPTGWVHGTLRMHPQTGEPYDLFLSSGKGDIAADVQAIGRLCSVIMRWPNHKYIGQATRLEIIRKQLFRIPGGQQEGFGPSATISMPDGIAHLLHQYLSGNFPLAQLPLGIKPMEQYIEEVGPDTPAREALRKLLTPPEPVDHQMTAEDDTPDFADSLLPDPTGSAPLEQCPECHQVGLLRQIGHCPHCVVCGLKLC